MIENNFLSLIIFAPLLGAAINWLIGGRLKNETFSGVVACSAVGVSCVIAFMVAFGLGTPHQGARGGAAVDPERSRITGNHRRVRSRDRA